MVEEDEEEEEEDKGQERVRLGPKATEDRNESRKWGWSNVKNRKGG